MSISAEEAKRQIWEIIDKIDMKTPIQPVTVTPTPSPPPAEFDKNGIAYLQPYLDMGIRLAYGTEHYNFVSNFRTDGYRFDFKGLCLPGAALFGYFFMPSSWSNDEVDAKLHGGPHNDTNPDYADVVDIGVSNFPGTQSRVRWEKTHPIYSPSLNVQNFNIGNLRGRWIGLFGAKVDVDTDGDGKPDRVALISAIDTGGLDSAGKPKNQWFITQKKLWQPSEIGLKAIFGPAYVCTIGKGSLSQETIRIDQPNASGLQYKYVKVQALSARRV